MHCFPRAIIVLSLLPAIAFAQAGSTSADPKQAPGTPQTPISGTQAGTGATTTQPTQPARTAQPQSGEVNVNDATVSQPSTEIKPQVSAPASGNIGSGKTGSGNTVTQPNSGAAQRSEDPVMPPAHPLPANPKTDILDSSATGGSLSTDGHDPILDPAPIPATTTTLVGGTITGVDRMRNRLTLHVFGGGSWSVNFDERTHIFRSGAEATQLALKKGERVYVDTQLDNNRHDIFARNIRVGVAMPPADADGQIVAVDPRHSELTLRDTLNSIPVRFTVDPETRITNGQTPAAFKDVHPGTLVHVRFAANRPNRGLAREIDILAVPGSVFTFAGKLTYLDLRRGILAIKNSSDDKNYEIRFSPARVDRNSLSVGMEVKVVATFEGSQYSAQSVAATSGSETMPR